ncbi:MAG: hypothetical protein HQ481_21235, partial [Alphaproteobacteria bacterium]|nr:hypothetical protein [Alphaproteobacteria bacterium]
YVYHNRTVLASNERCTWEIRVQTSAGMGRLSAALALGQPMPEDMAALGLTPNEVAPGRAGLGRG